jgi:hypothetical protein
MQILINQKDKSVVCTGFGKGRQHDFKIYKNSKIEVIAQVQLLTDKGYQGIYRYHSNCCIPHKKPRHGQLPPHKGDKTKNKFVCECGLKMSFALSRFSASYPAAIAIEESVLAYELI